MASSRSIAVDSAAAAFVSKLSPTSNALLYSTLMGGSADDSANGISVTPSGVIYVAGATASPSFSVVVGS